MKNVKIKYDQVLFLFVYLRQLDLSVHRCRWGSWTEFQSYYKNVIPPSKIIQYLKASFYLPDPELTPIISVSEKKTIEKIIIMLKANVFRRFHLTQDEILYYYKLLLTFDEMLNSDIEIYDADLVKLRMGVITYLANVLELIVSYNCLKINVKPGTVSQLEGIGVCNAASAHPFDHLPLVGKGWKATNAFF